MMTTKQENKLKARVLRELKDYRSVLQNIEDAVQSKEYDAELVEHEPIMLLPYHFARLKEALYAFSDAVQVKEEGSVPPAVDVVCKLAARLGYELVEDAERRGFGLRRTKDYLPADLAAEFGEEWRGVSAAYVDLREPWSDGWGLSQHPVYASLSDVALWLLADRENNGGPLAEIEVAEVEVKVKGVNPTEES